MKQVLDWVTTEMIRRKKQFHPNDAWDTIKCWGLFYPSDVRRHLKNGWLIRHGEGYNFRCLSWYVPSKEYYESSILPRLCGGV